MIDLSIEYQNYQQVWTVSKKDKEDRDMSPWTWALDYRVCITFERNNFRDQYVSQYEMAHEFDIFM